MFRKINTQLLATSICGVMVAVLLLALGISPGFGSEPEGMHRPKGRYDSPGPVIPDYPETFDLIGSIDRVGDGEVVISDSLFRLSSDVSIHTPVDPIFSRYRVRVGDFVGCLMNTDGEIESIWLLRVRDR
jgi:hypothetical protein